MARYQHALVTGGAGFIGSHLARCLLDEGMAVTVLDDLSVGTRERVDPRARFVDGDVRKRDDVRMALDGVDCVFHLAARVTIRGSFEAARDDADVNLLGTITVANAIDPDRVGHLTLASSMAVYAEGLPGVPVREDHPQEPISPYGVSKWAAERVVRQLVEPRGVRCSVVRYFNTYGPGQTYTPYVGVITIFVTRLLRGEPITIFGDGQQCRDFVHVDDIVQGTVRTLHGPPGTYNLGTGVGTTVNEVAALLVERLAPGTVPRHGPEQSGELRYSVADIGAARRATGYAPAGRLEARLGDVVAEITAAAGRPPRKS